MRERLIGLCKKAHSEWLEKEYDHETDKSLAEYTADHIFADGWIRLPCKVGDTLYYIPFGSTVTKWEIRSIEIMQDDIVFHCGRTFFLKYDIGKTVFLTKEEAENALKERERE